MTSFPFEHHPEIRETGAPPAVRFHFLGCVDWDRVASLQRRLVYEAGGAADGGIVVLMCEHPALITVGRRGSRGHIHLPATELRARGLRIRWVGRGGGCVLHGPGQLAVYPIVPLAWHRWTVGAYLRRLQRALAEALRELRVHTETAPGTAGIWGRSGALAVFGAAVARGVTWHGAFINVNPLMTPYRFVDVIEPTALGIQRKTTMGCLLAERGRAITMPRLRAVLVPHLAAAFGTAQYHLFTGHPMLRPEYRGTLQEQAKYRAS